MGLKTLEEIKTAVKEIANDEEELYNRHEGDFDKFRGEEHEVEKGYRSYTDNSPQTAAGKVIDIISKSPLIVKIPIDVQVEEERRVINDTERFARGALDLADKRLRAMGQPALRSLLAFHAVVRGWDVSKWTVFKDKERDGETSIQVDVWDRRWVRYEVGRNGISWIAHVRNLLPRQIKSEYGIDKGTGSAAIEVIDYWDDKYNAIIIGDDWYKDREEHECGALPVVVRPVGATPWLSSSEHDDTIKDVGESIYVDIRNIINHNNDMMGWVLDLIDKYHKGTMKVFSRDGQLQLKEDPFRAGTEIGLKTGEEDVVPVELPDFPRELGIMTNIMSQKMQQGLLPASAYGDLNFTLSGLALSQLNHALGSVIDRRSMAVCESIEEGLYLLTKQFSAQGAGTGLKPVELKAVDRKKKVELVKFKPEDIKPYRFEAKIDLSLPQDIMQKYMMAQIANDPQRPLLSTQTIMEEILGLCDTDLEQDKLMEDWVMRLPQYALIRAGNSLFKRGASDDDLAPIIMELMKLKGQYQAELMAMQGGMPQGPGPGAQSQQRPTAGMRPGVVSPGAPRPAGTQTRLRNIGLSGPNG